MLPMWIRHLAQWYFTCIQCCVKLMPYLVVGFDRASGKEDHFLLTRSRGQEVLVGMYVMEEPTCQPKASPNRAEYEDQCLPKQHHNHNQLHRKDHTLTLAQAIHILCLKFAQSTVSHITLFLHLLAFAPTPPSPPPSPSTHTPCQ